MNIVRYTVLCSALLGCVGLAGLLLYYRDGIQPNAAPTFKVWDSPFRIQYRDTEIQEIRHWHKTEPQPSPTPPLGFNPSSEQDQLDFESTCPTFADTPDMWEGAPLASNLRHNLTVLQMSEHGAETSGLVCVQVGDQFNNLPNGVNLTMDSVDWESGFVITVDRTLEDYLLEIVPIVLFGAAGAILGVLLASWVAPNVPPQEPPVEVEAPDPPPQPQPNAPQIIPVQLVPRDLRDLPPPGR